MLTQRYSGLLIGMTGERVEWPRRFHGLGAGWLSIASGWPAESPTRRPPHRDTAARLPLGVGLISFGCNMGGATVAKGTVKLFNAAKGYGFIQPPGGGRDLFVRISAVERAGLSTLNEGQTVEYEEATNTGKPRRRISKSQDSGLQSSQDGRSAPDGRRARSARMRNILLHRMN
jgi:cold shock protein